MSEPHHRDDAAALRLAVLSAMISSLSSSSALFTAGATLPMTATISLALSRLSIASTA
eukprot:CAMPEP_0184717928 /NCGR_PEP_ID=MMETSP0314-20130426/7252_1 /TAXON_ID=38298 /ORGANISM="Rhodella maculata, Strain CCMP 736" /LENGTH=57 /DNA_ID=CAMNT_0027181577 /DNA_START=294 /DNA_END=464 /DNA_ORIENTATION=-